MVRKFESADRLKWMEISPVKHAVVCARPPSYQRGLSRPGLLGILEALKQRSILR